MFRQIFIFTVLLIPNAMSERRPMVVSKQISFQQCNSTSCNCGANSRNHASSECNQACVNTDCKTLTCSSGKCHQECHNCHMECTSDVGYCRQRCLSGACSFKCNARCCVQQCNGDETCDADSTNSTSNGDKLILPKAYLILLAILFASVAILSCLLLVLYSCNGNCCGRQDTYFKLKTISSSLESLDSQATFV